jgi:hypothetical protein
MLLHLAPTRDTWRVLISLPRHPSGQSLAKAGTIPQIAFLCIETVDRSVGLAGPTSAVPVLVADTVDVAGRVPLGVGLFPIVRLGIWALKVPRRKPHLPCLAERPAASVCVRCFLDPPDITGGQDGYGGRALRQAT